MTENPEELPLFTQTPDSPRPTETIQALRPTVSLTAAIQAWGEALERSGRSINTIKAFTSDLRLLAKFIGAGQAINAIGTHDLKNFLEWMTNRRGVPCSPKTYARRITSLKSFFRWLTETGVLDQDAAAAVPQQTVLSPLPDVLAPEEIESILQAADAMRHEDPPDSRTYTLVKLLLDTGIKKSECLAIRLNHIDSKSVEGPILFVRYADVSKRYRERKLPLEGDWLQAYREYLEQYKLADRLFPYSPRRLEYLLEDIGEAVDLEKHLSFNMCRWTSALTWYQSGMEKDKIRQRLGLSKIQWREIGLKLDRLSAQMERGK